MTYRIRSSFEFSTRVSPGFLLTVSCRGLEEVLSYLELPLHKISLKVTLVTSGRLWTRKRYELCCGQVGVRTLNYGGNGQ